MSVAVSGGGRLLSPRDRSVPRAFRLSIRGIIDIIFRSRVARASNARDRAPAPILIRFLHVPERTSRHKSLSQHFVFNLSRLLALVSSSSLDTRACVFFPAGIGKDPSLPAEGSSRLCCKSPGFSTSSEISRTNC